MRFKFDTKKCKTPFWILWMVVLICEFILPFNLYSQQQLKTTIPGGVKHIVNNSVGRWKNDKKMLCTLVQTFGINQTNPDGFLIGQGPLSIFVDSDEFVYISDHNQNQIKIYSPKGNLFRVISESRLKSPDSIIVDSAGKIYVECSSSQKILVFSKQGKFIRSIDIEKYENGIMYNPKTHTKYAVYASFLERTNDPKIQGPIVHLTDQGLRFPSFGNPVQYDPQRSDHSGNKMTCKVLKDGRLAIVYLYPFAIQLYSEECMLQTIITRSDTLFRKMLDFELRGYRFKLLRRRLMRILSFPNGKFMLAYLDRGPDWIEQVKKGQINHYPDMVYELYDSTGVFLQEFAQPRNLLGLLIKADPKGFVYEISYPKYPDKAGDYVLNKYRIQYIDREEN